MGLNCAGPLIWGADFFNKYVITALDGLQLVASADEESQIQQADS